MAYIGKSPAEAGQLTSEEEFTATDVIGGSVGQRVFTLTTTVGRETDIIVSINGVLQPASAYTIGGTYNKTLTFPAPAAVAVGDVLRIQHIGYKPTYFGLQNSSVDSAHLVNGSVDSAHLATGSVDSAHLATGSVDSAHLANGSIDIVHLSATGTPSGAVALKGDNTWGTAAAPEVYGFSVDANGHLIVTTTNEGADNITGATYVTFRDVLLSVSGYTWSISGTDLIATV